MKLQAMSILITLLIIIAFRGTGFSNDPAEDTPWPIGFNAGEMNISRTLMNSYGDLNGSWLSSVFHGGIDIDATTGYLDHFRKGYRNSDSRRSLYLNQFHSAPAS